MWDLVPDTAMDRALALMDQCIMRAPQKHSGYKLHQVAGTYIFVFHSSKDAFLFAMDIQSSSLHDAFLFAMDIQSSFLHVKWPQELLDLVPSCKTVRNTRTVVRKTAVAAAEEVDLTGTDMHDSIEMSIPKCPSGPRARRNSLLLLSHTLGRAISWTRSSPDHHQSERRTSISIHARPSPCPLGAASRQVRVSVKLSGMKDFLGLTPKPDNANEASEDEDGSTGLTVVPTCAVLACIPPDETYTFQTAHRLAWRQAKPTETTTGQQIAFAMASAAKGGMVLLTDEMYKTLPLERLREKYQGYLVEAVDGLCLTAFHSPSQAILWALECNVAMNQQVWPRELLSHELCEELVVNRPTRNNSTEVLVRGLRLKSGVDMGQAVGDINGLTGRMAYRGKVMNRAARISAKARTQQVLCSAECWAQATTKDFDLLASKQARTQQVLCSAECWAQATTEDFDPLASKQVTAKSIGEFEMKGVIEKMGLFSVQQHRQQQHFSGSPRSSVEEI
eukprot:gene31508-6692_t